jgi:hypothetical protein
MKMNSDDKFPALCWERAPSCCGETLTCCDAAALLLLDAGLALPWPLGEWADDEASAHAGGLVMAGKGAARAAPAGTGNSVAPSPWELASSVALFSAASGDASDSRRAT